jgi:helix-turn-helix protein
VRTAEDDLISILTGRGLTEEAARAALAGMEGKDAQPSPKAAHGPPRHSARREKVFGMGRPRALDRNAKVRIMHLARCLSRRTEPGRHYGQLTAKAVAVLEAILWTFHNAKSGLCYPSYEAIAEAAGCARSTVAEAIKALEEAGVLSWVHRLKRVRVACPDLFGGEGSRIVPQRTSNAYHFADLGTPAGRPNSPESEKPTGTPTQGFFSSLRAACGGDRTPSTTAKEASGRVRGKFRCRTKFFCAVDSAFT